MKNHMGHRHSTTPMAGDGDEFWMANMAGLPHDIANFHDYPFNLINNPSKVPIHGHDIAIKSIIQIYLPEVP